MYTHAGFLITLGLALIVVGLAWSRPYALLVAGNYWRACYHSGTL
jgi:hypothetical protein